MSENQTSESTTKRQRAFLLHQLAADGPPIGRGELNKKIPAAAKRELQLNSRVADEIRRDLVAEGLLLENKRRGAVSFALTDSGREQLAGMEVPSFGKPKRQTPPADEDAITEELREGQRAFLLLQLLDADEQPLPKAKANKIPSNLVVALGLKPVVANYRRAKLAEQGYIKVTREGRSEFYSIAPDGIDYLSAGARHVGHARISLKGETLNALMAAARESSFERDRPRTTTPAAKTTPSAAVLEDAVLAAFEELRRERHSRSGLVPIHEVRGRMAEQFGPAAARHDALDPVIMNLWKNRRIGLEGISDLSRATEQQLNDSIPGMNSTFFYLEAVREPSAVS